MRSAISLGRVCGDLHGFRSHTVSAWLISVIGAGKAPEAVFKRHCFAFISKEAGYEESVLSCF